MTYPKLRALSDGFPPTARKDTSIQSVPLFPGSEPCQHPATAKRRLHSHLTLMQQRLSARQRTGHACDKCRDRKTKCSGEKPACNRCASRGLLCNYTAPETRVRGTKKLRRPDQPSNYSTGGRPFSAISPLSNPPFRQAVDFPPHPSTSPDATLHGTASRLNGSSTYPTGILSDGYLSFSIGSSMLQGNVHMAQASEEASRLKMQIYPSFLTSLDTRPLTLIPLPDTSPMPFTYDADNFSTPFQYNKPRSLDWEERTTSPSSSYDGSFVIHDNSPTDKQWDEVQRGHPDPPPSLESNYLPAFPDIDVHEYQHLQHIPQRHNPAEHHHFDPFGFSQPIMDVQS